MKKNSKNKKNEKSSTDDESIKKEKRSSEEEESSSKEEKKPKKSEIKVNHNYDNNINSYEEEEIHDQELVIKFNDQKKSINNINDFINDYNHIIRRKRGIEKINHRISGKICSI